MQRRLRIESSRFGRLINEYRIVNGEVEMRTLQPFFHRRREWRQMTDNEIQLHENLDTAVAHWIQSDDVVDGR
jgi:hypothetical protein